jgi:hypothetical protein
MVLAASAASEAAPGVLGFLVVAGMGLILYFLFRSMAKHLRNVSAPRQGTVAASKVATGGVATGGGVSDALANGSPVADSITRPAAERRSAKDSGTDF